MTTAQDHALDQVQQIALDLLQPSPRNPRRTMDAAAARDMAQSIRSIGITQPLIVRPLNFSVDLDEDDIYEIVAGHRRYHGAVSARLETAPCIVRNLSEEEADEIALVDNLQRLDVSALEEADAFALLYQRLGSVELVAARVGKDIEYVTKRLKLVSLGELSRFAVRDLLITMDHALLLARLGAEEQDAMLKWTLDHSAGSTVSPTKVYEDTFKRREERLANKGWGYWEPQSVLALKRQIEQSGGRRLSLAPWLLDDVDLVPRAGACNVCPSNTNANTALFSDLAIEEATCADGKCFASKQAAFIELKMRTVSARDEDSAPASSTQSASPVATIRLSYKRSESSPRLAKDKSGPNLDQVFRLGQWTPSTPGSCEHLRTGVTVDFDQASYGRAKGKPGDVLLVCVQPGCKKHPKTFEQKAKQVEKGERIDPKLQAEKEKLKKDAAIAESKIRIAAAGAAIETVKGLPLEAVRALAEKALPDWAEARRPYEAILPGIFKSLKTAELDSCAFAQIVALASIESDELVASTYYGPEHGRKELIARLKALGYDASKAWQAPAKPKADKPSAKKSAKTVAKKIAPKKDAAKRKLAPEARKRIEAAVKARGSKGNSSGNGGS